MRQAQQVKRRRCEIRGSDWPGVRYDLRGGRNRLERCSERSRYNEGPELHIILDGIRQVLLTEKAPDARPV